MLAIALLGIGAVLLWAAFTGRGTAIVDALNIDLPSAGTKSLSIGGSGGGGGGSSGGGGGSSTDSGTHQGLTNTGDVYTINSDYGSMSPQQQDDANRYANTIGNG